MEVSSVWMGSSSMVQCGTTSLVSQLVLLVGGWTNYQQPLSWSLAAAGEAGLQCHHNHQSVKIHPQLIIINLRSHQP